MVARGKRNEVREVIEEDVVQMHQVSGKYSWTINVLEACLTESAEFQLLGHIWCLVVYPRGDKKESENHVSVALISQTAAKVSVHYEFQLSGAATSSVALTYQFTKKGLAYGWPTLIPRASVGSGHLRIKCTISKSRLEHHTKVSTMTIQESALTLLNFSKPAPAGNDIGACLSLAKSCCSDVNLVVAGTEILAHRLILTARSGHFAALFESKMSESLDGVVRIDDIELPVFSRVLKYCPRLIDC